MTDDCLFELAQQLGQALGSKKLMLATAESCTGGWVAQVITAIAGSSQWFERGFITYSDASKQEMLAVNAQTLRDRGAVSEQTAAEMALGALARSDSQAALAVTGIAGPDGGTLLKPVGTVCFAWALEKGAMRTETRQLGGDREAIRRRAVAIALQGAIEFLAAGEGPMASGTGT